MLISLLTAMALMVASCGSGKSSDQSSRSATGPIAGASGHTGATPGPTGGRPSPTGSGGSTGPTGGSGGGAGKQGSSGGTAGGAGDRTSGSKGAGGKEKPPNPKFAPGASQGIEELYAQSKTVCHALTLDGLAREYLVKPKTPAAAARQYAKAYPASIRDEVYRGCKAGL